LWLYALTGLLFDILISLLLKDNLYKTIAANILFLLEFSYISIFYLKNIHKTNSTIAKSVIGMVALIFIVYNILNTDFHHLEKGVKVSGAIFLFISYIVYAISGLYTIIKEQKIVFIEKSSFFWANVAILIYGSGMFFLLLSTDFLRITNIGLLYHLWVPITSSINILEFLVLTLALTSKNP
jgi:hypothetical protein